ncbi:MAG: hypothetical protein ACJ8J0_06095 [Longimicrobiaceae bacterium]
MFRDTLLHDVVRRLKLERQYRAWDRAGRPGRPAKTPYLVKVSAIRHYARRHGTRVLVETGTNLGLMVVSQRNHFERIWSIELDPALHAAARERLKRFRHVTLLRGDSGVELAKVLAELDRPALFWLDAHWSGGVTARGAVDTPISQELAMVLAHPVRGHVVLIDDAHEFVGENGYPPYAVLAREVESLRPDLAVEERDNVIRITPRA